MSVVMHERRKDRIVTPDEPIKRPPRRVSSSPFTPRSKPERLRHWFERVDDRFMGSPVELHPHDAIIWAMRVSAGEVAYCDAQISRLEEDELFERPLKTTWIELPDSGDVEQVTEVRDVEQMNRWVLWRDHAMKNMATYAKMALDVGIEERQIQLAEQQAQQLVTVISSVLTDLGHDLKDIRTRDIVRRRLMEGAIEGSAQLVHSTTPDSSDSNGGGGDGVAPAGV